MQIQIFAQGIDVPDALRAYVERNLLQVLDHYAERLTRVEVYLKDLNSNKKNGVDKHCLLEARPRGMEPVAVEHDAPEFKEAVHHAVLKLERALQHRIDKKKNH
jgi:ribosomal subunit interface protein